MSTRLRCAIEQLRLARRYTLMILDSTDPATWFTIPPAGVSHIGWQVGHLAMADYRLLLERIRGKRDGDEAVFPAAMLTLFGRGTEAVADASLYPSANGLRALFDRVRAAALAELVSLDDAALDEPAVPPTPLFDTKLGAVRTCAQQEGVHAGQIALLRRQLGAKALW